MTDMRRSGSLRKSRGISFVAILCFVMLAYGIYVLVTKHSSKTNDDAQTPTLNIVIYTTPSCEPCNRAKAWMKQRQIEFEERNVESSPTYEAELKSYKSRIVPVILINGEPQYGFMSAHFEQALKDATRKPRD